MPPAVLCLALFLIVLGNSLLDILFTESSRPPRMDGCQLIAVAYLIQTTVLDVELAHYLCHRIMGFMGNTFRGFLTGRCHEVILRKKTAVKQKKKPQNTLKNFP